MINHKTLIIGILTILFAILGVSVLMWVVLEINKLGGEMETQVSVIADALAQERQYRELSELIEKSEPMRNSLEKFVLTEGRTIDFLAVIERIGGEQGVNLETTSLSVNETEDTFDTLLMSFHIEGDSERVEKMLDVLENLPYHSELTSVKLVTDPATQDAELLVTLAVSLLKP